MDSPCIKQTVCKVLKIFQYGKYLVAYVLKTDARHGWRKNVAQSDIVARGNITHNVVNIQTVTRSDEPISQRHELIGVKNMYKDFDSQNVKVRIHGHDRNSSVNKYLAQEKPHVKNK